MSTMMKTRFRSRRQSLQRADEETQVKRPRTVQVAVTTLEFSCSLCFLYICFLRYAYRNVLLVLDSCSSYAQQH